MAFCISSVSRIRKPNKSDSATSNHSPEFVSSLKDTSSSKNDRPRSNQESWTSKVLRKARSTIFPGQAESSPSEINESINTSYSVVSKQVGLLHRARSVLFLQRNDTQELLATRTDSDIKSYSSLSRSSPAASLKRDGHSLKRDTTMAVASFNTLRRKPLDVSSLIGKSISLVSSSLKGKVRDQSSANKEDYVSENSSSVHVLDDKIHQWTRSTEFCGLDTTIPGSTMGLSFSNERHSSGRISKTFEDRSGFETVNLYGSIYNRSSENFINAGSSSSEGPCPRATSKTERNSDIPILSEKAKGKQRSQLAIYQTFGNITISSSSISTVELVRSSSMIGMAGSIFHESDVD